jgi:hypothetical protein
MKCLSVRLLATLIGLMLLASGSVHANLIDYSWVIQPTDITSGNSDVQIVTAPAGSQMVDGTAPKIIPVATVNLSSTTTGTPDSFNANITMTGTFKDDMTGATQTLTFVDNLSGTLSSTSVGSLTLNNTFPVAPTQTLTLAGETYTVMISPSMEMLPPTAGFPAVKLNTIVTMQAPEPGTLALGSTAALLCGLFARRRRPLA